MIYISVHKSISQQSTSPMEDRIGTSCTFVVNNSHLNCQNMHKEFMTIHECGEEVNLKGQFRDAMMMQINNIQSHGMIPWHTSQLIDPQANKFIKHI